MSHLKGLHKAIRYYGSQKALAKSLGCLRQNVTNWLNRDEKITDPYALLKLFENLKGAIPLHELTTHADALVRLISKVILYHQCPAIELPLKAIQVSITCPIYPGELPFLHEPLHPHNLSLPILIDQNQQLITCECRIRTHAIERQQKILVHQIHYPSQYKRLSHELVIHESIRVSIFIMTDKYFLILARYNLWETTLFIYQVL